MEILKTQHALLLCCCCWCYIQNFCTEALQAEEMNGITNHSSIRVARRCTFNVAYWVEGHHQQLQANRLTVCKRIWAWAKVHLMVFSFFD